MVSHAPDVSARTHGSPEGQAWPLHRVPGAEGLPHGASPCREEDEGLGPRNVVKELWIPTHTGVRCVVLCCAQSHHRPVQGPSPQQLQLALYHFADVFCLLPVFLVFNVRYQGGGGDMSLSLCSTT